MPVKVLNKYLGDVAGRSRFERGVFPGPLSKAAKAGFIPSITGRTSRLFAVRDGSSSMLRFRTLRPSFMHSMEDLKATDGFLSGAIAMVKSLRLTGPAKVDVTPLVEEVDVAEAIYAENGARATVLTPTHVSAMTYGRFKYTHVRDRRGTEQIRFAEDHVQHPQMVLTSRGEVVVAAGFMTVTPAAVRIDGKSENFPSGTFRTECRNERLLAQFPAIVAQHRAGLSRTVEHLSALLKDHGMNVKMVE